jgi:sRNA-binding protein
MNIYDELRSGRSSEDIAAAFAAQLNEAEARIKAEEEEAARKAAEAAKEAEDAKVQKEEDIKNIIYSFGEMLENNYPEFGFTAEELDEQTLDSLAAIAIMLLDIEVMKHTSAVRVKPAKSNKTFELHKTNSDEVFKDFFKSLGL